MKSTSEFNNFFEITNDQEKIIKYYYQEFKKIDYSDWNANYLKNKQDFDDLIIFKIKNQKLNLEISDLKKLIRFMEALSHLDRAPTMLIKYLESNPKDLTLLNEKLYNFYLSREEDSKFYGNLIELLKIRRVGFAMATLFSCYFNNKKFPFYSDQQWSIVKNIFKIPDWNNNFILKEQLDFFDSLDLKEKKFVYKIYVLIEFRNYINRFSSETFDFFDLNQFLWHIYKNKSSEQIQGDILKQWKIVLENYTNLDLNDRYHFNIEEDKERMNKIKDKVKNFIENHDANEEMFIDFWNDLYSAIMAGRAKNIIKKNRTGDGLFAIEKVKKTLEEMLESKNYYSKWEDEEHIDGAQKTLWELFGVLHINIPILNNCSRTALNYLLGKDIKDKYFKIRDAIEEFKGIYLKEIGHITGSPEIPESLKSSIYLEIDKLFNVIDKVKEEDIEIVKNDDVRKLFELSLELKQKKREREINYWIFQSNPKLYDLERAVNEINEDLFSVTRYKKQIKKGDKVIFWVSGGDAGVIGYGEILTDPKIFDNLDDYNDSDKYFMDKEFKSESKSKEILRVRLSYIPLEKITKDEILSYLNKNNIEVEGISFFKSNQGTNFPINKQIWEYITTYHQEIFERNDYKELFSLYEGSEINPRIIIDALKNSLQIILMGPPGTSKSYLAEKIALQLSQNKKNVTLLQFHPSYSYEDFVEAKEVKGGTNGQLLEFYSKPKVFVNICEKARKNQNQKYVLILDEINRGNVEKIFGELIWALENRGKEVSLMYSENPLIIPNNVYLIGTMNTVDLSISNIDSALLRRFLIIEVMPSIQFLKNWFTRLLKNDYSEFIEIIVKFMVDLNNRILHDDDNISEYQTIGHSYFMMQKGASVYEKWENFKTKWEYSIKPLLLQYHNFNSDELSDYDRLYTQLKKDIDSIFS